MSSTRLSLPLLLASALLAGCATADTANDSAEADSMNERCDASPVQQLVGQLATPELLEQAREEAGAELVRTLKPGEIITMEFDEQRLNLEVDAGGVITRIYCG